MKRFIAILFFVLMTGAASAQVLLPAILGLSAPTAIVFHTTGSSFAPLITTTGSPTVLWTFSDGTTSSSTTPSVSFGSAASRVQALKVTPWSGLTGINLGYTSGADVAPSSLTSNLTATPVSRVDNLYLTAPYLTYFAAMYNYITGISFDNFTALTNVEMFGTSTLASISVKNTSALKRFVVEQGSLTSYDVSSSPALEEVRSAYNALTTVTYGASANNQHLWHICTHHNPFTNTALYTDMTAFPDIVQLWIQDANQSGTLKVPATGSPSRIQDTSPPSFQLEGNHYSAANFSGAMTNASESWLIRFTNGTEYDTELTSLDITGCAGLTSLDISHTSLNQTALNGVLSTLDGLGRTGGTLTANSLTNTVTPGAAGWKSRAHLVGKGWTVTVDGTQPLDISVPGVMPSLQAAIPISTITLAAVGGTSPYTYAVSSGSLPAGLTLSSGAISGTPTTAGSYGFTLQVTDSASSTATNDYAGTVAAAQTATINFTTTGSSAAMDVRVNSALNPTVTWTWSDSTTTTTAYTGTKSFGSAGTRNHTLTVTPAQAVMAFGSAMGQSGDLDDGTGSYASANSVIATGQGISAVSGLSSAPNLKLLFFYNESLTALDITGCTALTSLRAAANPIAAASTQDAWFTVLDAAGLSNGIIYYNASPGVTSSSATARSNLTARGWSLNGL